MDSADEESFGVLLKRYRLAAGLSQETLAEQAGLSHRAISALERGVNRTPRQTTVALLADALRLAPRQRARFVEAARPGGAPATLPLSDTLHNLPVQATTLIGREQEVTAVLSLLQRPTVRLLTLTGPGGVGKTRVALQVAEHVLEHFDDGVWFVELAPIRDPAFVASTIARGLGLREAGSAGALERLLDYLRNRQVLLVLDNFEAVIAAASLITDILAACRNVKVLVTSQAALHVRGERLFPVPPLPLPDLARLPTASTLAQNAAVALFVERAQAATPDFALTQANALLVATICSRLDGLPLAIELVAARVKLLPLDALLTRLDRRLVLLTNGPRDLPARHRTLRAAIDWSYDLLDTWEQAIFRRLGIFVGGWTLVAAEAVCGHDASLTGAQHVPGEEESGNQERHLLDVLASLLDKSLIQQHEAPHPEGTGPANWWPGGGPSFAMRETIREYAAERLGEHGELPMAQRAHAAYFLGLAELAAKELHGPDQVAWLDRLEEAHANLRAALGWTLERNETGLALRFAGALWWFWYVRGYASEGRRWLDRVLDGEVSRSIQSPPTHPLAPHIAEALYGAGYLALFQADFAVARDRLNASAAIWRGVTGQTYEGHIARRSLAYTLIFLVVAAQFQGDIAAVQPLVAELMPVFDELDDAAARAIFLFCMGRGAVLQHGDFAAARPHLEQSLALFRRLGDVWYMAQIVIDLGVVALYRGDYAAARAWYEEGLLLARALKDRAAIAAALNNLGEVARCEGDYEQASEHYVESLHLHQRVGNRTETPRLLHNLGYVALRRGETAAAAMRFRESLGVFQQIGMIRGVAENLAAFAAVTTVQGRAVTAARLWGAAEGLHEAIGTPVWPSDRREHDRYQAIARTQLDEATWWAAWQEGRAMSLEQAVAAVLKADS